MVGRGMVDVMLMVFFLFFFVNLGRMDNIYLVWLNPLVDSSEGEKK